MKPIRIWYQSYVDYENGNCAVQYRAWRVTGEPQEPNPACYGGDSYPPPSVRSLTTIDPAEFVAGTLGVSMPDGWSDYRLDAEDGAWRIIGAAHDGAPSEPRRASTRGHSRETVEPAQPSRASPWPMRSRSKDVLGKWPPSTRSTPDNRQTRCVPTPRRSCSSSAQ